MSGKKVLFIDRDGTIIIEPPDQQIDSLPKLALVEGVIPALVPAEIFEAVAERLRLNAARSARNNHEPEAYLLRGGYARGR